MFGKSDVIPGRRLRVGIINALAPNPELLLLDEPFAAIDAKVRQELRGRLKQTIYKLGITAIFVTHDQNEAVEVADEIIITNRGRVEQSGAPIEIYQSPKTPFVAKFIGESVQVPDYTIFKGFDEYERHKGILRPEFLEIGATIDEMPQPTPVTTERGIVRGTYFRGSVIQVDVEIFGVREKIFYNFAAKVTLIATGGASRIYLPNHAGGSRHQMCFAVQHGRGLRDENSRLRRDDDF